MAKPVSSWADSVLLKLARLQVAETRGVRFLKLAAEARSRIVEIPPLDAAAAIKSGAALLDVRERGEFQRGHIPGATHLSRGTIELEIEGLVTDASTAILVYCGAGNRSALAADNLQRMGYTNVKSIAGGFQAWLDAGLPAWRGGQFIED